VLGVVSLFLVVGSAWGQVQYTVTDLGTLGGSSSTATGINNKGQVVGGSYLAGNAAEDPFIYSGGVMTDLGTVSGFPFSGAAAINDAGQVVGNLWQAADDQFAVSHAFLYANGVMTDLGTMGYGASAAGGINSSGQVVGWAGAPAVKGHAFLYSGGVMTELGVPSGNYTNASGINDSGLVVGQATPPYPGAYLYSLSAGTMTSLGNGDAIAINAGGQIVGQINAHAFLYSGGVTSDLGTLGGASSEAQGINTRGQVVGDAYTAGGADHAFLYTGTGGLMDLNDLLATNPGWTLQSADGINDAGQIVGYGVSPSGQTHAFLLTPTPEPSTLALLGVGSVCFAACAFRRRKRAA
jgi:probable HAF family extracellular repeat protein